MVIITHHRLLAKLPNILEGTSSSLNLTIYPKTNIIVKKITTKKNKGLELKRHFKPNYKLHLVP